jgi:hypothetical protein
MTKTPAMVKNQSSGSTDTGALHKNSCRPPSVHKNKTPQRAIQGIGNLSAIHRKNDGLRLVPATARH